MDQQDYQYENSGSMVILEGWLHKAGRRGTMWKRRYCVLLPNTFTYYDSDSKRDANMKGSFEIKKASFALHTTRNSPTPYGFTLSLSNRTYYFAAFSETDLNYWGQGIEYALYGDEDESMEYEDEYDQEFEASHGEQARLVTYSDRPEHAGRNYGHEYVTKAPEISYPISNDYEDDYTPESEYAMTPLEDSQDPTPAPTKPTQLPPVIGGYQYDGPVYDELSPDVLNRPSVHAPGLQGVNLGPYLPKSQLPTARSTLGSVPPQNFAPVGSYEDSIAKSLQLTGQSSTFYGATSAPTSSVDTFRAAMDVASSLRKANNKKVPNSALSALSVHSLAQAGFKPSPAVPETDTLALHRRLLMTTAEFDTQHEKKTGTGTELLSKLVLSNLPDDSLVSFDVLYYPEAKDGNVDPKLHTNQQKYTLKLRMGLIRVLTVKKIKRKLAAFVNIPVDSMCLSAILSAQGAGIVPLNSTLEPTVLKDSWSAVQVNIVQGSVLYLTELSTKPLSKAEKRRLKREGLLPTSESSETALTASKSAPNSPAAATGSGSRPANPGQSPGRSFVKFASPHNSPPSSPGNAPPSSTALVANTEDYPPPPPPPPKRPLPKYVASFANPPVGSYREVTHADIRNMRKYFEDIFHKVADSEVDPQAPQKPVDERKLAYIFALIPQLEQDPYVQNWLHVNILFKKLHELPDIRVKEFIEQAKKDEQFPPPPTITFREDVGYSAGRSNRNLMPLSWYVGTPLVPKPFSPCWVPWEEVEEVFDKYADEAQVTNLKGKSLVPLPVDPTKVVPPGKPLVFDPLDERQQPTLVRGIQIMDNKSVRRLVTKDEMFLDSPVGILNKGTWRNQDKAVVTLPAVNIPGVTPGQIPPAMSIRYLPTKDKEEEKNTAGTKSGKLENVTKDNKDGKTAGPQTEFFMEMEGFVPTTLPPRPMTVVLSFDDDASAEKASTEVLKQASKAVADVSKTESATGSTHNQQLSANSRTLIQRDEINFSDDTDDDFSDDDNDDAISDFKSPAASMASLEAPRLLAPPTGSAPSLSEPVKSIASAEPPGPAKPNGPITTVEPALDEGDIYMFTTYSPPSVPASQKAGSPNPTTNATATKNKNDAHNKPGPVRLLLQSPETLDSPSPLPMDSKTLAKVQGKPPANANTAAITRSKTPTSGMPAGSPSTRSLRPGTSQTSDSNLLVTETSTEAPATPSGAKATSPRKRFQPQSPSASAGSSASSAAPSTTATSHSAEDKAQSVYDPNIPIASVVSTQPPELSSKHSNASSISVNEDGEYTTSTTFLTSPTLNRKTSGNDLIRGDSFFQMPNVSDTTAAAGNNAQTRFPITSLGKKVEVLNTQEEFSSFFTSLPSVLPQTVSRGSIVQLQRPVSPSNAVQRKISASFPYGLMHTASPTAANATNATSATSTLRSSPPSNQGNQRATSPSVATKPQASLGVSTSPTSLVTHPNSPVNKTVANHSFPFTLAEAETACTLAAEKLNLCVTEARKKEDQLKKTLLWTKWVDPSPLVTSELNEHKNAYITSVKAYNRAKMHFEETVDNLAKVGGSRDKIAVIVEAFTPQYVGIAAETESLEDSLYQTLQSMANPLRPDAPSAASTTSVPTVPALSYSASLALSSARRSRLDNKTAAAGSSSSSAAANASDLKNATGTGRLAGSSYSSRYSSFDGASYPANAPLMKGPSGVSSSSLRPFSTVHDPSLTMGVYPTQPSRHLNTYSGARGLPVHAGADLHAYAIGRSKDDLVDQISALNTERIVIDSQLDQVLDSQSKRETVWNAERTRLMNQMGQLETMVLQQQNSLRNFKY